MGSVLMTGFSPEDAAAMGVIEGEMPLVQKPFTSAHLLQVVRRSLDERGPAANAESGGHARA